MCGFIFYQNSGSTIRKNSCFYDSSKLLYSRGPDFQKYEISKKRKIFHSRLKIIDLHKRSSQPMKRNGYSIVYNGEIYNYIELKKKLKKFFIFSTNSDTEVLLYAFLKWGKKMFDKIEGMYSFVIYKDEDSYFFAARDTFGQKPLYYSKNNSEIFVSSEIKPIISFLKPKITFEEKEIYKYLNHNYFADDKYTFFKNIFQLPPGSYFEFKNQKFKLKRISLNKTQYKNTKNNIKLNLIKTLKQNLVSDVEVALLYSGGIDSFSIYDLLPKSIQKKIKLFNLSFENFENKVSKINKKNYYSFTFRKKNFFSSLNSCSKICESPPLSLFTLGYTKLFSSIKKKKIKVVLNGQGIDENFGGYRNLFTNWKSKLIYHPDGSILAEKNKVYKKNFNFKIKKKIKDRKLQFLKKIKIPKNMTQIDKLSMKYSLECRSPYLSNLLYNSTKNLKEKNMFNKSVHKYLFRKILYSITKNKFYFSKKNYLQTPQEKFLKDRLILSKIEIIIKKNNYCDKYFYKKNIFKYLDDFKNNKNNGFIIWQYISLNSFCNSFKN